MCTIAGKLEAQGILVDSLRNSKFLLENGSQMNKEEALLTATSNGHIDIVKFLIEPIETEGHPSPTL